MSINMSSIMGKVKGWSESPEGKRRIDARLEQYRKEGRKATVDGSRLVTEGMMYEAADRFITILRDMAKGMDLPEHVMQHIRDMYVGETVEVNGKRCVMIHFGGDLSRASLYDDKYKGIDNIVALFNNGVHAKDFVYGWWDDHKPTGESVFRSGPNATDAFVRSRKDRDALNFVQRAVEEFNEKYSKKYNVTAVEGEQYRQGYDWSSTEWQSTE